MNLSTQTIAYNFKSKVIINKTVTDHGTQSLDNVIEGRSLNISSSGVTTLVPSAYDMTMIPLTTAEEHVRKVVETMLKRQNMFRYYSVIWCACTMLLGIFLTSLISGFMGPFTSFLGVIVSSVGLIGGYLDWKDWDRNNAF